MAASILELQKEQPAPDFSYVGNDWSSLREVGVMLGSFDPIHQAHEAAARRALARLLELDADAAAAESASQGPRVALVLLVPACHFHSGKAGGSKSLPLQRRVELLRAVLGDIASEHTGAARPPVVLAAIAHQVLFLRLDTQLQRVFPNARVHFFMGSDTYECVRTSATYYAAVGLPWSADEEEHLAAFADRTWVFERAAEAVSLSASSENLPKVDLSASDSAPASRETLDGDLVHVASTSVRLLLVRLADAAPHSDEAASIKAELAKLVSPRVLEYITDAQHYSA